MKELLQPENLNSLKELAWLATILAPALLNLSTAQRLWVREKRDGGKCQGNAAGIKHRCGGGVQVHHILSGLYLAELGIDADQDPSNLISICSNLHDTIHNGKISEARDNYRQGDKEAFKKMHSDMKQGIKNKELNWNPEWDRKLHARAMKLNQEAMRKGESYPLKRTQQEEYKRKRF